MHSRLSQEIPSRHNELFQGALVGELTNRGAVSPSFFNPPGFEEYNGAVYKFIAWTCRNGILASFCMILAHCALVEFMHSVGCFYYGVDLISVQFSV
jgi:hypothetical protein